MIAGGIASKLDCNREQREKLDRIEGEIVAKIKENRSGRENGFGDVVAMVKKNRVTRDEVVLLIDRREAKMREMKPFLIDKIVEFHAILTPAQRQKIADGMLEFHDRCGPR
ncbi:MAG: hypothetical protein E4G96_03155 [Chrysiogenales bacterium]|nr:MAG: hypothetical protein E4G96_03155 [Chrysiogenales bacterium]